LDCEQRHRLMLMKRELKSSRQAGH
jgi:hypothetical protein